jgi:hypothetical protein
MSQRGCGKSPGRGEPAQSTLGRVLWHGRAILARMRYDGNLIVGVVPSGLGSILTVLPRTYVRGYRMSSLSGLESGGAFGSFSR